MSGLRRSSSAAKRKRPSTISQMLALLGRRRRAVVALSATSILSGFAEAGILAMVAQVATSLVNDAHRATVDLGPLHIATHIGVLILVALGLCLFRLLLQAPLATLPARIAADVQGELRKNLFESFTRATWEIQSQDHEGHLQELATNQVMDATQGALQVTVLLTAMFSFIVLLVSAFALNLVAAGVVLGSALLLFVLLRRLTVIGHRRAHMLSQAQIDYAGAIGEAVRLAEETHVFGATDAQQKRINRFISHAQDMMFRTQVVARIAPALYQSMIFLVVVAGLGALYEGRARHVASLGAVVLLLVRAGTYGQQLQSSYQVARQALPFLERIQSAKLQYEAHRRTSGSVTVNKVQSISFADVSYSYQADRPVLADITFDVSAGEIIGIVGPSGAGKSTLIQLLLRLRMPTSGQYLLNGEPVSQFSFESWHEQVAYVPQSPKLLHATVADNIRYFRDLDDASVEHAARLARIHDDIMSWADGYSTVVGPRADAVSGGQQQRICLARALVAQPRILVLDEPTSALDPSSEALFQESLRSLPGEVTMFIAAHRMSTLDMCDRVMVIVSGRVDGFDKSDLLQRQNSYYQAAIAAAGVRSATVATP